MALKNLFGWMKHTENGPAAACGTACGAGDKTEQPAACGAGDKTETAACGTACGAGDDKTENAEQPAACGTACGAGDN